MTENDETTTEPAPFHRSNPVVYPITWDLEQRIVDTAASQADVPEDKVFEDRLTRMMVEYVGEYEHGSADIDELIVLPTEGETDDEKDQLDRLRLKILADVYFDLWVGFTSL